MNKYDLFLKTGHVMTFEAPLNANNFKYPMMVSSAENSASAELDFHKIRIFCDSYYKYYKFPRLWSIEVNGSNIKVQTQKDPCQETCMYIMDIWQGAMGFIDGECEIIKSKNFK